MPCRLKGVGVGVGVGVTVGLTHSMLAIHLTPRYRWKKLGTAVKSLGEEAMARNAWALILCPTPMETIVMPVALMAGATAVPYGRVLSTPSVMSTRTLGLGTFLRMSKHPLSPEPEDVASRACTFAERMFLNTCGLEIKPERRVEVVEKPTAEYLECGERAEKAFTMDLRANVCRENSLALSERLSSMAKQRLSGGQEFVEWTVVDARRRAAMKTAARGIMTTRSNGDVNWSCCC